MFDEVESRAAEGSHDDPARTALEAARAARRATRATGTVRRRGAVGQPRRGQLDRPARGLTGPGPDPDDPQPFGALIDRLIRDRGWERTAAEAAVVGRWDVLVGPDIAAHSEPESLRDGELVLAAESTAWATQLRLLAGRIVAVLSRELGPGIVTRVHVRGPTAPSWRRGPRRVAGRGPRDTYG